jgi:mono/diheme cytochrome c family protein
MTAIRMVICKLTPVLIVAALTAETVAEDDVKFSRDVLPILSDNCFSCHGPDANARKADLRLDTKEGALRTENPVIVPGKSAESDLVARITSPDPAEVMPPPKSNRKLTPAQIESLRRWIDEGAVWGKHWAFEPPQRPAVPAIDNRQSRIDNPIDAFILARLEREGLSLSPQASKETLIRRVTLDLSGLPPTLDEVDAFVADTSPDAYEKVVDRLLASPRFGERMVWEWLDAARYADTNGYQGDPTRTMHFWRDWVIDALNSNMPFDQFTVEQLAGDLLPNPTQAQLVATGFHRNHMINGEGGRIAEESRVDYVQDRVETTGTVWLGLTFNCCRCHDHKFDPFTQREYYQLSAFFNSIEESGSNDAGGLANPVITLSSPEQLKRIEELKAAEVDTNKRRDEIEKQLREALPEWEKSLTTESKLPDDIRAIVQKPADQRSDADKKKLTEFHRDNDSLFVTAKKQADEAKKSRDGFEKSLPRTMVMRERPQPRDTFILVRGAYDKFADKVTHAVPSVLPPLPSKSPTNRLALARWLVSPDNPLTARVTVNRMWQTFFGMGLVKTAEDFGVQGEKPSHPELLDWLATEFVGDATPSRHAWDVKHIIRLIVTSATYRQASVVTPTLVARDPENRLLARGARYRWPSWMIRDQSLAIGGLLVEKVGGPPVKGYQPAGIWEEATFGKIGYSQDHGESLYRRSLYQFWRRIVGPTVFFDVAARQTCQVKTARTNTPLHALVTLNDVTYVEAARALAERVLLGPATEDAGRLTEAFRRCTSRPPRPNELAVLTKRLATLRETFSKDESAAKRLIAVGESKPSEKLNHAELAAYTSVATLLLNLDETITKE